MMRVKTLSPITTMTKKLWLEVEIDKLFCMRIAQKKTTKTTVSLSAFLSYNNFWILLEFGVAESNGVVRMF